MVLILKVHGRSAPSFASSPTLVKPSFALFISLVQSSSRSSIVCFSSPKEAKLFTLDQLERTRKPYSTTLKEMEPESVTTKKTPPNSCSRLSTQVPLVKAKIGTKYGKPARSVLVSRRRSTESMKRSNMSRTMKRRKALVASLPCHSALNFGLSLTESSNNTGECQATFTQSGCLVLLPDYSSAFPSTRQTLPRQAFRTSSSPSL